MPNYTFLNATGTTITAASSTISGVEYPVVMITSPVSIVGTITAAGNQSVSGRIDASVVGTVPTTQSGIRISSISGNLTVGSASISGTVVVQSIVGTYGEDAGHATGNSGLFTMGVRNDDLSSITSADLDYSPHAVGPAGEGIVANAPLTKWVQGVASAFTGIIQPVIAAQGTSIFTYITSGQVANASANNVYLTISSGGTNIAYLPVPANSGALPIMPNAWKGLTNAAISASVSGVASVYLSFQGFISKV